MVIQAAEAFEGQSRLVTEPSYADFLDGNQSAHREQSPDPVSGQPVGDVETDIPEPPLHQQNSKPQSVRPGSIYTDTASHYSVLESDKLDRRSNSAQPDSPGSSGMRGWATMLHDTSLTASADPNEEEGPMRVTDLYNSASNWETLSVSSVTSKESQPYVLSSDKGDSISLSEASATPAAASEPAHDATANAAPKQSIGLTPVFSSGNHSFSTETSVVMRVHAKLSHQEHGVLEAANADSHFRATADDRQGLAQQDDNLGLAEVPGTDEGQNHNQGLQVQSVKWGGSGRHDMGTHMSQHDTLTSGNANLSQTVHGSARILRPPGK